MILKTHVYMEPLEFGDGHGFKSVVEMKTGRFYLISEVHRKMVDETLVFLCNSQGEVSDWTEVFSADTTHDAISHVGLWNTSAS